MTGTGRKKHTPRKRAALPGAASGRRAAPARDPGLPPHFYSRFVPDDRPVKTRACDHPGCASVGEYRAPREPSLDDSNPLTAAGGGERRFYWFCLEHVKAYNHEWNFYKGLNVLEMEEALRFDAQWNRPSWPLGQGVFRRKESRNTQGSSAHEEYEAKPERRGTFVHHKAELEALAVFGLEPPVDLTQIKKRYRQLVKHHHPDVQTNESARRNAEEKIKEFNSAFTLLKVIYTEE